MSVWDIVNQDSFQLTTLTAAINKSVYVPGQIGASGLFQERGIVSITALIEELNAARERAQVRPRGAPALAVNRDKRKVRDVRVPHIPQQGAINADEIRTLRAFGQEAMMAGIQELTNQQLTKMRQQSDYAVESHRLTAIKGSFIDANGDTINANTFFGTSAPSTVSLALSTSTTKLRTLCHDIIGTIEDALGGAAYSEIHAWLDPTTWREFVDHASVKETYLGYVGAAERAGQVMGSFVFGEIRWHRYRGAGTDTIGTKAGYAFPVGVDQMFLTRFAPSTWLDSVGSVGLPYYARAKESANGDAIELDSQSNPLNICTRPNAIVPLSTP